MVANKVVPGLTVTIEVNDKKLKEYKEADFEETEGDVVRYVEALSNQDFSIKVKVRRGFKIKEGDSITCVFFVDGQWASAKFFTSEKAQAGYTIECAGFLEADTLKKFRFNKLETVSDGRKLRREDEKVKHLGTIHVQVYATMIKGTVKAESNESPLSEIGIVSEKVIKGKAISHSVGFGDTIPQKISKYTTMGWLNDSQPIATFEFRYRSLDALKAETIIPREVPLEEKNFKDLTLAELRELHRRAKEAKELEDARLRVKRENHEHEVVLVGRRANHPVAGDTLLAIDEDESFHEASTDNLPAAQQDVIMIDD